MRLQTLTPEQQQQMMAKINVAGNPSLISGVEEVPGGAMQVNGLMDNYYNLSESMEGLAGKFKTDKNKEIE